jgi:glycine cleavage system H protein
MIPGDRKYSNTHEWVKIEGDLVVVGITDYAQDALGDITFVELPEVGKNVDQESQCGVVESVKVANDIFAPIAGEIAAVNTALGDKPELLNEDPYEKGWIIKLSDYDQGQFEDLMINDEYEALLERSA